MLSVQVSQDADRRVVVRARPLAFEDDAWPYRSTGPATGPEADRRPDLDVTLVPYHDWANRGPSTMRVWIPTT